MTDPHPTPAQLEAWRIDQEYRRRIDEAKARGAGSREIDSIVDRHLCVIAPLEAATATVY